MYRLDQLSLVVGLQEAGLHPQSRCPGLDQLFQVAQCRSSVDLRLPGAEQVEVGPVEDQDAHHATWGRWSGRSARASSSTEAGSTPGTSSNLFDMAAMMAAMTLSLSS